MFSLSDVLEAHTRDQGDLAQDLGLEARACAEALVDVLAVAPEQIQDEANLHMAYCAIDGFADLDTTTNEKMLDLIISGLGDQAKRIEKALEEQDTEEFADLRVVLEIYGFLLYWYLLKLESSSTTSLSKIPASGSKSKLSDESSSVSRQITAALDCMCECFSLSLGSLFGTSMDRDLFAGLFLKPVYLFMENEQQIKVAAVRQRIFRVLGLAVQEQRQQSSVQIALMQQLTYFEHLAEPLAEIVAGLCNRYGDMLVAEDMLKELSKKDFNSNDTKGPKYASTFISKLSLLAPAVLLKFLTYLIKLLESEAVSLRCAIIEATGNVIINMCQQRDDSAQDDAERQLSRLVGLLDLVDQRMLDVNPYCRVRAIQVLTSVTEQEIKFPSRRLGWTQMTVQCLQDKSSLVRKNALKLLSRLISTHPFGLMYGSQLVLSEWIERLAEVDGEIDALDRGVSEQSGEDSEAQVAAMDDDTVNTLQMQRKYHLEAVEFIKAIHKGLEQAEKLLFSKVKSEIIESMDLFILADAFGVETARMGVRKMIHLIWAKANNDDGQAIQAHLVECYRTKFFEAPVGLSEAETNATIARSIISLTYEATLSELASLEELIVLAMKKDSELIAPSVVRTLWKIYGSDHPHISQKQRRGAIIILGMLSKADHALASAGLDQLLKVGLSDAGVQDLALAKYTCIALQQCVSEDDWKKPSEKGIGPKRFAVDHNIILRLADLLLMSTPSMEWFGLAEQATRTVNDLCENPVVVFSQIIRIKAAEVFGAAAGDAEMDAQTSLGQLLFIVGEVALKTMVHLERLEGLFKRSKMETEKNSASKRRDTGKTAKTSKAAVAAAPVEENDLDMVGGGTSEEDFTEVISFMKEREILYGDKSLLAKFGAMVSDICREGLRKQLPEHLSISATLCLGKLMCVSSAYCEAHLPLLMTYMERSDNAIIRNNSVLALGDIAVCFNHILNDNTDFLYRRLHDKYSVVQRTCLMTLTFLILAGQVKVKGQLGEMAKCLEDSDERISNLSRMFFTELATKDNAIYNGFTDMFSVLNADEELPNESLHRILKFLLTFINKDRQVKQLSDKLVVRLRQCDSQRTWDNLAYVLNALPHKSDEIARTVTEGYKYTAVQVE